MIKKVVMVCAVVALVTVLAGVAGGIQTSSASNPSTTSVPKNLQFQSYTGPVVGSKNSDVYHYPSCYHVKQIKPENLVTFNTIADACAAGYRPCKDCNPPPCGTTPTATPTAMPTVAATAMPTAAPTSQPKLLTSPTPTSTPTPTSAAAPTGVSPSVSNVQASASQSSSSTPGFEAVYALGALAAAFLAISVARRK